MVKTLEDIKKNSACVNDELDEDFSNLISGIEDEYLKIHLKNLFWQEQKKSFERNPKAMRWHPMVISFALHIHLRSPSAYQVLLLNGLVEEGLRNYANTDHSSTGFYKFVFDDGKLNDIRKYVVLMLNEV